MYAFLNLHLLSCKWASYLTDSNWVKWNEEPSDPFAAIVEEAIAVKC